LEHVISDPLGPGSRLLITGAQGQLGTALREVFPRAETGRWDISEPLDLRPTLVFHAAAWTDVDGAEQHPAQAELSNVLGTRNVAALGAPIVYYSTDYVFDGTKTEPYVESDAPNPLSVYGRTKLEGEREVRDGWIVRTSWLFGWSGRNFVRTMLELGRSQNEVRVVDDQIGCPTFVGHLAAASRDLVGRRYGIWHVAASGSCTWAEFAEAIFEEATIECRVIRITSEELGRPAPRPRNSVLRSERRGAPRLPHWRDGLRECLRRL
jgi:dTDP-4-dehydrorhamnose reductase